MMNIFTPDSAGSAESLKQQTDFANYIRVDPSNDSRDDQNTGDLKFLGEKSSCVLECSISEMEKENSNNQNNVYSNQ